MSDGVSWHEITYNKTNYHMIEHVGILHTELY